MQRVERRVVVTGIGLVTPLAIGTKESWQAAIAGKSGVGPITRFNAKELPSRIAGEVKNFDPAQFMDKKEARRNDLFIQFGLAATDLALKDAGLPTDKPLGERSGVIVGSGMGGLATLEETHLTAVQKGHRRVSPFFIPSIIVNLAGGQISIRYGAAGVNFAPVSASATGNHPLRESMRHLQHGGAERAMQLCMQGAGLRPEQVQYVNGHGASTPVGDTAEVKAIKSVFGDWAKKGLMVSSTKSMTGHLLGAAGGVEAGFSALALYHGIIPPTINVDNQDPQCDVDVVPNQAREVRIKTAVSNSFGFGGTNVVVALQRFE